jgi:hypothetical protein
MFQSSSSEADVKKEKTPRSSGLRSMSESFQKRVPKGRLTDILTGGSKSHGITSDDDNETPIRDEPLSTTSTSSKEGKRGPFRQSARTPRSPPQSPRNESSTKSIASVANAPDNLFVSSNMLATGASEHLGDSLTSNKPVSSETPDSGGRVMDDGQTDYICLGTKNRTSGD